MCLPTWKILKPHNFGIFIEAGSIFTSISSPCPLSGGWGVAEIAKLLIWWSPPPQTTQVVFLEQKMFSALITYEFTGVSAALCQESEAEINIYFLLSHKDPVTDWLIKGNRICHPKRCIFGIRIIFSYLFWESADQEFWKQTRNP